MNHDDDVPQGQDRRAPRIVAWAGEVLLAAFAYFSHRKLSGAPNTVESFEAIGVGEWLRYVVGNLELAGAVGLLVPGLAGLAALGLAGLMVGAVVTVPIREILNDFLAVTDGTYTPERPRGDPDAGRGERAVTVWSSSPTTRP